MSLERFHEALCTNATVYPILSVVAKAIEDNPQVQAESDFIRILPFWRFISDSKK